VDYLAGHPAFEAAGLSEAGTVWARFADGRPLIVVDGNRESPAGESAGAPAAPPVASRRAATPSLANKATRNKDILITQQGIPQWNLPTSKRAVLMNTFVLEQPHAEYNIRDWLNMKGYNAKIEPIADVKTLKTKVKDVGVFFFTTHGGPCKKRNGEWYQGLMTATLVTSDAEVEYKDDLDQNRLGYAMELVKGVVTPKNYTIMDLFVEDYFTFSDGSVVFIDACLSFQPEIRLAFTRAGAWVYLGWEQDSPRAIERAALEVPLIFFDHLLGVNQYNIENSETHHPPLRPFSSVFVYDYMVQPGLIPTLKGYNLGFDWAPWDANMWVGLVPAIVTLSVYYGGAGEEDDELRLAGYFGSTPGSVTIDGVPAKLKGNWDAFLIVVELPLSGPGSAGDVVVDVDGRKSP
jgi:hypothetical protein